MYYQTHIDLEQKKSYGKGKWAIDWLWKLANFIKEMLLMNAKQPSCEKELYKLT